MGFQFSVSVVNPLAQTELQGLYSHTQTGKRMRLIFRSPAHPSPSHRGAPVPYRDAHCFCQGNETATVARHGHVAPECGSAGARRLAVLLPSGAAERYAS
jgi:hypothetical protein